MKLNKLYALLAGIMIFSMILVACAPEVSNPIATPPTAVPTEVVVEPTAVPVEPTAVPTEAPTATVEVVEPVATLKIWADDTRTPILQGLAEQFLADYNVELVVEDLGRVQDIRSQAIIAIPAGEGPDIFIGVHDWLGALVDSGLVAPVDLGDKTGDFVESNLEAFTYTDGNLYGLPYASENLGFFTIPTS